MAGRFAAKKLFILQDDLKKSSLNRKDVTKIESVCPDDAETYECSRPQRILPHSARGFNTHHTLRTTQAATQGMPCVKLGWCINAKAPRGCLRKVLRRSLRRVPTEAADNRRVNPKTVCVYKKKFPKISPHPFLRSRHFPRACIPNKTGEIRIMRQEGNLGSISHILRKNTA